MRIWLGTFDGMHAMYLNSMLRALVFSLVGIFTPLYVYLQVEQAGYLGWYPVAGVALFYLLSRAVVLLSCVPISRGIERIGFRKSVLVSAIFLAIYLCLLKISSGNLWLVALAAVMGGLNIPWYWIARGSLISQDGSKQAVGRQMGWLLTTEQVVTILGPITAGLIIQQWGFSTLYGLAFVILCLSLFPLWHMPTHTHRNGASWRGFISWLGNRRYFHQAVGVAGKAVDDYAITMVWPLSIYLMGWQTSLLGGLFSGVAIISLLVRYIAGRSFDLLHQRGDYSDEIVLGVSSVASSIVWVIRIFITSVKSIVTLDAIGAVFGTLYGSMYINYEHLGGMRMGNIAYWVYVELIYSLAAAGVMGVMILGAWLGIWRELIFLLAALWVLLGIVQARESNLK